MLGWLPGWVCVGGGVEWVGVARDVAKHMHASTHVDSLSLLYKIKARGTGYTHTHTHTAAGI